MEKDKHKPSLEHSRLLILERIDLLGCLLKSIEAGHQFRAEYNQYLQELAGHEQGLKALDSHYALIEALKETVALVGAHYPKEGDRILEEIPQMPSSGLVLSLLDGVVAGG